MRRGFIQALFFAGICIALYLVLTSCGFIGELFNGGDGREDEDGDFNNDQDYYMLTVDYHYRGGQTVSPSAPIVFWFMPLDEEGRPMSNPDGPEGDSLREEARAFIPSGSVSLSLEKGSYIVLAFTDSVDNNGYPSPLEHYVFYDEKYFVDAEVEYISYFDPETHEQVEFYYLFHGLNNVDIYNDQTISVGFGDTGMKYEWHAVYIVSPDNGEYMWDNFTAVGGLVSSGGVSYIEIEIDGVSKDWAVINGETWYFDVDIFALTNGLHTLTAKGYDKSDFFIDSYSISFDEFDGL